MEKCKKPKVLIVDDTPANLQILVDLIGQIDCIPYTAISGEMALKWVESHTADLILLDIHMPGINGIEVCNRLKNSETHQKIPIIFISAVDQQEMILKAFKAGGADYIAKPFKADEVLARVQTHLKLHQTQKQLLEEMRIRDEQEQFMIHQAKFSTISRLMKSVSHQWRQPLNYISLSLENIKDEITLIDKNQPDLLKSCDDIILATHRLSGVISKFSDFFNINGKIEKTCFTEIVDQVVNLFNLEHHDDTKIINNIPNNLYITCQKKLLAQVILTILDNGHDAITKNNIVDKVIEINGHNEENIFFLEIYNNGGNISGELGDKIFEPYFTTKFEGQGIGLGLYMAQIIVDKQLGGELYYTNQNEGVIFTIKLPDSKK